MSEGHSSTSAESRKPTIRSCKRLAIRNPPDILLKPISGFPFYYVGDDGSAWRFRPCVNYWRNRWYQLRQHPCGKALRLHISNGTRTCFVQVHDAVLEAFVGPRPSGTMCIHIDGDKRNNRLSNLKWGFPGRDWDNEDRARLHPTRWLRPGESLMSGGYDWSWAYVVFRKLDDWPGYMVSSCGDVWSSRRSNGVIDPAFWRKLSPGRSRGYLTVTLKGNISKTGNLIHRLVLGAFVGPCPDGLECCHGNGVRLDNRIANLRWDTCKANSADMTAHGTRIRGEAVSLAKLNENSVREIRRQLSAGITQKALALKYGVADHTISMLARGKTWQHVV